MLTVWVLSIGGFITLTSLTSYSHKDQSTSQTVLILGLPFRGM